MTRPYRQSTPSEAERLEHVATLVLLGRLVTRRPRATIVREFVLLAINEL